MYIISFIFCTCLLIPIKETKSVYSKLTMALCRYVRMLFLLFSEACVWEGSSLSLFLTVHIEKQKRSLGAQVMHSLLKKLHGIYLYFMKQASCTACLLFHLVAFFILKTNDCESNNVSLICDLFCWSINIYIFSEIYHVLYWYTIYICYFGKQSRVLLY